MQVSNRVAVGKKVDSSACGLELAASNAVNAGDRLAEKWRNILSDA